MEDGRLMESVPIEFNWVVNHPVLPYHSNTFIAPSVGDIVQLDAYKFEVTQVTHVYHGSELQGLVVAVKHP